MTYFESLPIELNSLIAQYLVYSDLLVFNKLVKIDYNQLYLQNFKKYYNKDINNYDISIIYTDLLNLHEYRSCTIKDRGSLRNNPDSPNDSFMEYIYIAITDKKINKIKINEETIKYLSTNSYIELNIKLITILDDVKLFQSSKHNVNYFSHILANNSYNILNHIIENGIIFDLGARRLIADLICSYGFSIINLKMTKLIFKHFTPTIDDMIYIMACIRQVNKDSFTYLLHEYEISNIDKIIKLLIEIFERSYYTHFLKAFNLYRQNLSNDSILELYRSVLKNGKIIEIDQLNIIVFLSNLTVVKDEYLYSNDDDEDYVYEYDT